MGISFSTEELQRVEEIKSHYPENKAAVMPVLWMSQKKWGWISDEVKEYVADLLDLSYSHVHGVASFYTMYFKKAHG
jgi:NADH:ubiquinone oxidoreductase subunit E